MKKWISVAILFTLFFQFNLYSQNGDSGHDSGLHWSIFWNSALSIESDVFNRKKITVIGLGTSAQKIFNSGIGIEGKLSFKRWSDLQRTIVPLRLGPLYQISSNEKTAFLVRVGFGPELIVGNDYASIFAGFDVGPEVQFKVGDGHAIILGFTLAQAMSFHPGSFEYLDLYVGWRF